MTIMIHNGIRHEDGYIFLRKRSVSQIWRLSREGMCFRIRFRFRFRFSFIFSGFFSSIILD